MSQQTLASKPEQAMRLILETIARQGLNVGDRIPSRPDWRKELGISNDTLDRALRNLISDGTLVARAGSGTFLNKPVGRPAGHLRNGAQNAILDVLVPKELGAVQASQTAHVVLRRLDGIARACRRSGLSTSLQFLDPYRFLSLDELLEHLGPLHDGIVFLHDDLVARIEEHLMDRRIPFAVAGNTQRKSNAVLSSVREAYLELMKHLASIGRKRIAYLAGDPASQNSHLSVVQHAAAACGLKLHRIYWVDREVGPVLDRLVSRELKEHDIDAVLCRNDHWALDVLATFSSHGIGVPRDVVVVGCDDIAEAAQAAPSLATIAQPYEETGEAAVACVEKMLHTGVLEFENLSVESRFVARASALPENGGSIAQVGVSNRKGRPIHAQEP